MHETRQKRILGALTLGICLSACALVGPLCDRAHAQAPTPDEEFEKARMEAAALAEKAYGTAMKVNKDVATAISIVRGLINQDPFALVNVILDLMADDGGPPDITVRQARDEIIAEIRKVREEELTSRASSLVDRFGELLSDPQNMTFEGRLENYLDDSADLFNELYSIMNNGDPARAEMAYHLAPAFNTVASSRAVGLGTAGLPVSNVDNVMGDAYNTNLAMVSTNGNPHGGYLYDVAQKYAGLFVCSEEAPTISTPVGGGINAPYVARYWEMVLAEGWKITANVEIWSPNENGMYPCKTDGAQMQIDRRFDADPIVHLVRASGVNQLLSLASR